MMMTLLSRRAEQVGIPYHFSSLTADKVKNEWYGKTGQLLAQLLLGVQDPTVLSLLFVDDIDLLLKGDRNAAGTNSADLDLMKGLMDFFSGTGTRYRGNYVGLAATNQPTATEAALRQRFVHRAIIKGPQTAEDYIDLVALELRGFSKNGLIDVHVKKYAPLSRKEATLSPHVRISHESTKGTSWDDIGKYCEELKKKDPRFTGRPVRNAIQSSIALAADFEVPEEWFINPPAFRALPWDQRVEMIKELYKKLSADHIIAALGHQFETEQRYLREDENKRLQDRVSELELHQKAVKLALKD